MGLRVFFQVYGQGGKFDIVTLLYGLGAGVGLLGISSFVCDLILHHLLPDNEQYLEEKYQRCSTPSPSALSPASAHS